MTYSRTLDGLRGVAILLVLLFHFDFILGCGWIGVQLFFVLSGFLITSILLKEKSEPLDFYLKRFYWRRTLRIFPLYYAYLLMIVLVFAVAHIPEDLWTMFPFLATYTFNFFPLIHVYSFQDYFFMHFWSLSVEEQFYLIWPIVIFLCNEKQLRIALIAIIAGAPVCRLFLGEYLFSQGHESFYTGETVYRFTLSQWDGFAFGALIPLFSLKDIKISAGRWIVGLLIVILGLGAWNFYALRGIGDFIDFSTLGYEIANTINYQHVWSYTLFDALACLLIVYVLKRESAPDFFTGKVLGNKLMVYVGKISYGLYVYHFIIWMTFNKYINPKLPSIGLAFVVYLITTLVVASASYYIFEKPILMLKDKVFTTVKPAFNESN